MEEDVDADADADADVDADADKSPPFVDFLVLVEPFATGGAFSMPGGAAAARLFSGASGVADFGIC